MVTSNPNSGDYQERRPLEFVSDEDFHRLLLNLNTASFSEYRDSIIIQLLLDTGMRIRECLLICKQLSGALHHHLRDLERQAGTALFCEKLTCKNGPAESILPERNWIKNTI